MDDVLDVFAGDAANADVTLDFSLDSLSELERYWLSLPVTQRNELMKGRFVRYLGETFRRKVGGKWRLFEDEPRNICFGLPVVDGFSTPSYPFCPQNVFENFVLTGKLGLLRSAVEADMVFSGKEKA
jgi:hypothetical protein